MSSPNCHHRRTSSLECPCIVPLHVGEEACTYIAPPRYDGAAENVRDLSDSAPSF